MSFYVTLPSNASMDVFPDNKVSDFKTLLEYPINLNRPYEVGLSSISYRHKFYLDIGAYEIIDLDRKKAWITPLFAYEGETFNSLFSSFNKADDDRKKAPARKDLRTHNKHGIEGLKPNDTIKLNYELNEQDDLNATLPTNYQIAFYGLIAHQLEIPPGKRFNNKDVIVKNFDPREKIHRNENMFIYTDIIEDQYVGNTRAKLLETIAISGYPGQASTTVFNNPHYVDVCKNYIETIQISIKDSAGINIHFQKFAKLIIKLHFRPKKNE